MQFIAIQKLGRNGDNRRLWIESRRLEPLGFAPGTPFQIEHKPEQLTFKPAVLAENHVSSRNVPGGRRPIIDLANQSLLDGLRDHSELKVIASFERIQVTPSVRAFAIRRSRSLIPPCKVLEVFTGGGTMTTALANNPDFHVTAGLEINPDFADEWQARHPAATLVQADLRLVSPSELPDFDVLAAGVPCTSHSNLGRAKKGLAGRPELGDTGDLFLPLVSLIATRMPAAVVLENVPGFGSSLAGELLVSHLERIGYHVAVNILNPNEDWAEIEDRKRWLLIATLNRPFVLKVPGRRCEQMLAMFLDPPNAETDRADAARIARTIDGLRRHNARHQAAGHGFQFTVVDGTESKLPTIPKSYHKINTGPFVQTDFGPRMLRQSEIERIHGCALHTQHYATAVRILGQGVLTPIFKTIFDQLGRNLLSSEDPQSATYRDRS